MYRAGLESILGFKLRGERLRIDPCIPQGWREFEITYRRGRTVYRIKVSNPLAIHRGVASLEMDGKKLDGNEIELGDDGSVHQVNVVLGEVPVKAEDEGELKQQASN
jgi:cyclic beta-1,2-glucan synthetase